MSLEKAAVKEARKQKNQFLAEVADCRPDLFKYCRRLTNNPLDAEDLVQETLMVAYGRLAYKHAGIDNLRSYLFKMATNQWITWCRRKKIASELVEDSSLSSSVNFYQDKMFVVQDSLSTLLNYLPPRERVAFVLSDVFESKNEEIAEIMGSTEGAVKSALVRAREKLAGLKMGDLGSRSSSSAVGVGVSVHSQVLSLAVEAFNKRDIEGFAKLFAVNAVGNAPGCFFETSAEEIKKGSLFYTINTHEGQPQPASMQARIVEFAGEKLFALFDGDVLDDVWKFTAEDGLLVRFDCYFCCPDVLAEIASELGKKWNGHGYWFEQGD
jgi:RNA polymerase sigma-70 factor (ECF subfamily)